MKSPFCCFVKEKVPQIQYKIPDTLDAITLDPIDAKHYVYIEKIIFIH